MSEKPTVIVVEDEPFIALDLEQELTRLGCTVLGVAHTEEQAFDLLAAKDPDLAILDVQLGTETSFGIAAFCHDKDIPVIFSSAYDLGHLRHLSDGHPFLTKPVSAEALAAAVRESIRPRLNE